MTQVHLIMKNIENIENVFFLKKYLQQNNGTINIMHGNYVINGNDGNDFYVRVQY